MGIITTAGGFVVALTALIGFAGLCWRGSVNARRGYVWIKAWALRNEQNSLEIKALGQRLETTIGSNGGSTVFDRMNALEDGQARIASIADALKEPSVMFDPFGQVFDMNVAFRRATGWSLSDLERGGWRAKLADDDRDEWDDAISSKGVFERTIQLRGAARPMTVHLRPIGGARFLGWRAVCDLDAQTGERRRVSDRQS